jgi:peptide/nickel transport system substrate-binding protein
MKNFNILVLFLFNIIYLSASTLHLSISSSPSRLNPILATDSASGEIASWVFNPLVEYDKDGKIIPRLAKSWHFEDNKTLIFKLKKGIKWSDGKSFDANDVIFTYKLITSPKVFTPYASEFRYIKNIKKLDDYTLKVTYKKPYFKALNTWMTSILPKHLLENKKNIMTSSFNQHPIGTGPYIIDGFEVNKDIVLKANPNYFIHKPYIDSINYHYIPDPSTTFLMLKTKKLDVGGLSPLQVERQLDSDFKNYYNIYERISNGYTYLGFNLKNKKFKNPLVRKAIDLAIDKKELVDILFFGHGQICNGPFMPGTWAYNNKIKSEYNPKKAKQILKSLGFSKEKPFEFTITTNSNNDTRVYAVQIIQHQLNKVGIKVHIRTMEWQAFLNTVVMPKNFEAVVLGWGLSLTPDAYSIWHSEGAKKGGFNFVNYKNKKVDNLIKRAETTIDKKKLSAYYQEIFKLIVNDHPYIFLYIPNSITAVNKKIKNVSPSIIGIMHNEIDWIKP